MRNTSYPAIALLVSVFILITVFAFMVVGYNNYLQEQREASKEIIEEFAKYNVFQYYLYVLSDYEARKAFFNAVYNVFVNSIDSSRYLDISKLNKGILGFSDSCKNFTDYKIDYLTIEGSTIVKYPILIIYPCIKQIPLFDFQNNLNKNFIDSIINNFRPEEHLNNITSFYGVDIKQSKKDYFIGYDYFNLYQEINYSYTAKTYSRRLNIGVNYSLIPSIFIYNQLLAKEYQNFYDDYIRFLKSFYGSYQHPLYVYKSVDWLFENVKITYSKRIEDYVLLFSNPSERNLKEFENFLSIYLLNGEEKEKKSFKVMYEFPIFCWHFGQEAYEYYPESISYVDKNGCKIAKLSNRVNHSYDYFIEECLLSPMYYRDGKLEEIDMKYAELIFYNFSFYDFSSNQMMTSMIYMIYGTSAYAAYGDYLWSVGEKHNILVPTIIGKFIPVRCVIGEKVYNKTFTNEDECWKFYKLFLRLIEDEKILYIDIRKVCNCTKWDVIQRKVCNINENGEYICDTVYDTVCREYLFEWIERIRNVSEAMDKSKLFLAIYYPYYEIENLKYLISS